MREVGYSHATTRAIAHAAGVAEGTLYRHFPNKSALFLAAVLERNAEAITDFMQLPGRAGLGTVEGNLIEGLTRLAAMREDVIPLEIAYLSDPELADERQRWVSTLGPSAPPLPPMILAQYLMAEQRIGRIRAETDCPRVAMVLFATFIGLSIMPAPDGKFTGVDLLDAAVRTIVAGLGVPDGV